MKGLPKPCCLFSVFVIFIVGSQGSTEIHNLQDPPQFQGTWNQTLYWRGNSQTGVCEQCGNASFACSDNSNGDWNNGFLNFIDKTPPFSYVVEVRVTIGAHSSCSSGALPTQVFVLLQQEVVGSLSLEYNSPNCNCSNCMRPYTIMSTVMTSGWPYYNYSGDNSLQFIVSRGLACLSYATITATWQSQIPFPTVDSITPSIGPIQGDTSVLVSGSNFFPGFSCFFGDSKGSTFFENQQSIKCITPSALKPSNVSLAIGTYQSKLEFVYYEMPVINDFFPTSTTILGGINVTVRGTNFFESELLSCLFGPMQAPAFFVNETTIICTAPPQTAGTVVVGISENNQQYSFSQGDFEYIIPVPVEPLTPSHPPVGVNISQYIPWIVLGSIALLAGGVIIGVTIYTRRIKATVDAQVEERASLLRTSGNHPQGNFKLKLPEMQIDLKDIEILERIGRGSAGDVYKGIWHGTEVAVKLLPAKLLKDDYGQEQMIKEAELMMTLRHPNVLQFLGAYTQPPNICIIMEFMTRGSLYKIIHDKDVTLTSALVKKICVDATRGLNYLHNLKPPIIHRDLKSHNLLVDVNFKVKVADFGLSTRFVDTTGTMTACGTPCWTAPEVLRKQHYSEKVDIYSMGVIFWELLTREDPYSGMDAFQVVYSVGHQGLRPRLSKSIGSPLFVNIITDSWDDEASERPNVDELLKRLQSLDLSNYPYYSAQDSDQDYSSGESPPKKGNEIPIPKTKGKEPSKEPFPDLVGVVIKPNVSIN